MPISLEQVGEDPGIVWRAPHDAEIVACALFSCPPSFMKLDSPSPTGAELKKISNFEQCVLLFRAAPVDQSTFVLVDDNRCMEPEHCATGQPRHQVVTGLAAACWAYDTTSVIAASDLVHVPGTMLPRLGAIPHDSLCANDGDDCYDAGGDRFGVCSGGTCRPRCVTAVDCSVAELPRSGSQCGWSCAPVPGSELGACVPRPL